MSCQLPFNTISVADGGSAGPSQFSYGTGALRLTGQDNAVTTADGKIHNYRAALNPSASCQLCGDRRSLDNSAPSLPKVVTLSLDSTTIYSFPGIVSVEYDSNTNVSNVNISGCEVEY